jgi:hypothetical protein
MPRVVRTIQALLSKKAEGKTAPGRRARIPGVTIFLDVEIAGADDHFVERAVRIAELPPAEAGPARSAIRAAIPARTGRVI